MRDGRLGLQNMVRRKLVDDSSPFQTRSDLVPVNLSNPQIVCLAELKGTIIYYEQQAIYLSRILHNVHI